MRAFIAHMYQNLFSGGRIAVSIKNGRFFTADSGHGLDNLESFQRDLFSRDTSAKAHKLGLIHIEIDVAATGSRDATSGGTAVFGIHKNIILLWASVCDKLKGVSVDL